MKSVTGGVLLFLLMLAVGVGVTPVAHAQKAPLGMAEYIHLDGDNIKNGQIISFIDGQYQLSDQPYDPKLYGVVVAKPAVAISLIGRAEAYPVLSSGTADVLVSRENGPIASGDYITASRQAGIGMKATQAGFVIGTAQADVPADADPATIPVSLDVKFVTSLDKQIDLSPRAFASEVQNIVTVGLRAVAAEPNSALRYAAAALVLIASIAFGFLVFGRAATNGVAAVGRNPLAKKSIFVMVLFNISMTIVFSLAGVGLAIFILAV